jgi:hypothetical protein
MLLTAIVVQVNNTAWAAADRAVGRDIFELVTAQMNPASWAKAGRHEPNMGGFRNAS